MFDLPVTFLPIETAVAWLVTFLVHSTLLLGGVWLISRRLAGRSLALEETLWKSALVGAVVTASLQVMFLAPAGWGLARVNEAIQTAGLAAPVPNDLSARVSPAERSMLASEIPATQLVSTGSAAMTSAAPSAGPAARLTSAESRLPGWQRLLFGGWLLGAALLSLVLGVSWWRLSRRLKSRRRLDDGPVRGQLDRLIDTAGARDSIRLSAAEALTVPIALGTARPEICLPNRALEGLTEDELDSLLAHELAHVLRRDPAWLLACRALESVMFLQPLVRVARKRLQTIAEYRCDAWASALTERPVVLARVLTEVASWLRPPRRGLLVPSMASDPSRLGSRVRRILEQGGLAHVRGPRWVVPAAIMVLLTVAFVIPGLSPTVLAGESESAAFHREAEAHDAGASDSASSWTGSAARHSDSADDWSDYSEGRALSDAEVEDLAAEIAGMVEFRTDEIADLVGDALEASRFGHEIVGDLLADSFDSDVDLELGEILEPVLADLDRVVAQVTAGVAPLQYQAYGIGDGDGAGLSEAEAAELAEIAAEIAERVVVDEAEIARITEMAESIARRAAPDQAQIARLEAMAAEIADRAGPSDEEMVRFEQLAAEIAERATPDEAELEALIEMAERAEKDGVSAEEREQLRVEARRLAERMRPNQEELERLRTEARRLAERSRPNEADLERLRAEARKLAESYRPNQAEIERLRTEAREMAERMRPDRAELERLTAEARRRAERVMEQSEELRERQREEIRRHVRDRERSSEAMREEIRRREIETRREVEERVEESRERVRELERENERLRRELREREEASEPPSH